MNYKKVKTYNGESVYDTVDVYVKLDGVRALRDSFGNAVSRDGKPLHNVNHLEFADAEIFLGNWSRSISAVRTESYMEVTQDDVYELSDGAIDPRLFICTLKTPTPDVLLDLMYKEVAKGNEGIVIRTGNDWLRVVPEKTADVLCTGIQAGTGKNLGKLGALITNYGKVGTGFTDEERTCLFANPPVGKLIQVKYRERNASGKLRFPSFQRVREDKSEESFD